LDHLSTSIPSTMPAGIPSTMPARWSGSTPRAAGPVFRVLGPVGLGAEGRMLAPGKPTTLLAALLLRPNVVVSAERLKAAVWNRESPLTNTALHTCVRRLRRELQAAGLPYETVRAEAGGYRIDVDPTTSDLLRFRQLVEVARAETDPVAQLGLLREALGEWRGSVLANVDSDLLHRDEVPRLTEERLAAHERAVDLELELGRCREVLAELWELTRTYPDRERFWEQLIEALYRSGRQAEALAEYRGVKDHLRDQLGIDPGPALQRLELAILRGAEMGRSAPEPKRGQRTAPRSPLPAPPLPAPSFICRDALCARLAADVASPGATTVLISGPPGIGKSALALHVAELLSDRFSGGRVAVRTTQADGSPRPLAELRAETECGFQAAGSGPRLLVLDDVVDAETARALAVTGPDDATVVTSRLSLAGLVATHGAHVYRPGPFAPVESMAFLREVLGADRIGREEGPAAVLAELCGHYPLALRIATTRLLTRPLLSIADYADWLRVDPVHRLTVGADHRLAVGAVLQGALGRLETGLAEAFVRLGSEVPVAGTFSAVDCKPALDGWPAGAEDGLRRLADAGFLEEDQPDRFYLHELLRTFAAASNRPPMGEPA
jgi:DNA-binding SARP family transcriptional activator